jgi:hypothetical protein
MITLLEFETPIAGLYLRNNRSSLQKSIRCFPTCGNKGHVDMGFCGLPLRVRVRLSYIQNESSKEEILPTNVYNCQRYIYYAEIRPSKQQKLSALDQISERELIQNTRTKKMNEKGEIFLADFPPQNIRKVEGGEEFLLQFNSEKCSYDYGWKSNRWSVPLETHVVDIICIQEGTKGMFKICSYCFSSPFIIVSSHKRNPGKKAMDATAAINDSVDTEFDQDGITTVEVSTDCQSSSPRSKRVRKVSAEDSAAAVNDDELKKAAAAAAANTKSSSSIINPEAGEELEIANVLMSISYCNDRMKYVYDNRRLQEIAAATHLFKNCDINISTSSKSSRVFTTSQMESVLSMPLKRASMDEILPSKSVQSSEHSCSSISTANEGGDGAGDLPLHNLILATQQFDQESAVKC